MAFARSPARTSVVLSRVVAVGLALAIARPAHAAPAEAWQQRRKEAIELAEAGTDHALGGSGVLVTGSVITAGEARTLMSGRRP